MHPREWKPARREDWPENIIDDKVLALIHGLRNETMCLPPRNWCKTRGGSENTFTARCEWQKGGGTRNMWRAARYIESAQKLL